jgi:hypothetical protein
MSLLLTVVMVLGIAAAVLFFWIGRRTITTPYAVCPQSRSDRLAVLAPGGDLRTVIVRCTSCRCVSASVVTD